jgi:hypothetical protein
VVCLVLVLATGKFFNKVDQAESLDCCLAPGILWGTGWWTRSEDKLFRWRRVSIPRCHHEL